MAGRLTPRDRTTLDATQNTGCVIADSNTGGLFRSDGTNWVAENPPGMITTDTSTVPASTYPSGTTVFDSNLGLMVTTGTVWLPAAGLPKDRLQFGILGGSAPSTPNDWIIPAVVGVNAVTGSVATATNTLFMAPFCTPAHWSLSQVKYMLAANGTAGATGYLAIYDSDASYSTMFPNTLLAVSGALDESQASGTLITWTVNQTFERGHWLWIAYLKTAGSTALYCPSSSAQGAGVLGRQLV